MKGRAGGTKLPGRMALLQRKALWQGWGCHRQRQDDEVLFGKETVVKLSHAPRAESCRDDVTA